MSVTFDGDILENGKPSLRILGKATAHLQSMIDRAWIDNKKGSVAKHAKLASNDYPETEFFFDNVRKGSFIIDFGSTNPKIPPVIDLISSAVSTAYNELPTVDLGEHQEKMAMRIYHRQDQIRLGILTPTYYQTMLDNPDKQIIRRYAARSIVKELDQIISVVRSENAGKSRIDLTFQSTRNYTFSFDRAASSKFHKLVSKRILGSPIIYTGILRQLDRGTRLNPKKAAKFTNDHNGKSFILHVANQNSFDELHPFLIRESFSFIGCPVLEYGTFDPIAGDVFYIGLV